MNDSVLLSVRKTHIKYKGAVSTAPFVYIKIDIHSYDLLRKKIILF